MKTLQQIMDELSEEHPILTECVNGTEVELSPQRRLETVAKWAQERFALLQAEASPPVPASVTRAQLKLALIEAGLYQRTVDYVNTRANFPDEATWKKVQVNWADRLTFERQHPVVLMLMQALGVSSDQADALWITAANL